MSFTTDNTTHYAAFLKARAAAGRAIGRFIVAELELGRSIAGLVGGNGNLKGLDIVPAVAVEMARVNRKRRAAAHAALRVASVA